MKPKNKRVYQKRKQRKFKHAKHPTQALAKPVKQLDQKASIPSKFHSPSIKFSWIKKFFSFKINLPKKAPKEKKVSQGNKIVSEWLKKHDSDVQLILFPLILLVILIMLSIVNSQLFVSVSKQEPIVEDQSTALNPYPYVQAVGAPTISAKAAIILDRGSQVILYSKNPQLRFSMASTTKIMTALVALDYYKPNDVLTIKTGNVPGSGLNFFFGEQFHFMDLLYAMLLPSANDAAQAIADNYPGGQEAFVRQMNEKTQSLHLINTHYADPIGLDDDNDYSTVIDMARLASFAISNPTFVQVTSTRYKTIYTSNFQRQYPLNNTNELLGIDGVTGIKTGTTEGAREVLVTSVVRNSHKYIIVVMDSNDRFADTKLLLNFIDSNVKYIVPPPPAS
jgi:D-alanyl-D-alanine carboxypeptidase (penicillin-binding protein 5/6)